MKASLKAHDFDKDFDDGKDVLKHLNLSKVRRVKHEQKRVNVDTSALGFADNYGALTSEFVLSDEYLEDIERQFKRWAEFLNSAIGILAFTLALASLGTKMPWLSAVLSIVVVTFVRVGGSHIFPNEIDRLRKAAKNDPKAKVLLAGLTQKHLGISVLMLKYPVFLIGTLLLFSVAVSPIIVDSFPSLAAFYGT